MNKIVDYQSLWYKLYEYIIEEERKNNNYETVSTLYTIRDKMNQMEITEIEAEEYK